MAEITASKVTEWLKQNPRVRQGRGGFRATNLKDGYKATGYNGPPLKVKEGNLSNNRGNLRLAKRGENGDAKRKENLKLRQPVDANERTQNRRQAKERAAKNRVSGRGSHVIDHRIPLDRLGETVEGKTPEQAQKRIKELEGVYGPLGDRPGNRQVITAQENEQKRQEEKAIQQRLGEMEDKQPSSETSRNKFAKILSSPEMSYALQKCIEAGTITGSVLTTIASLGGSVLGLR